MSKEFNDGGPAFPVIGAPGAPEDYPGMKLRDYFAAKALPAVIREYCEGNGRVIGTDHILSNASAIAYKLADAMLRAREAQ